MVPVPSPVFSFVFTKKNLPDVYNMVCKEEMTLKFRLIIDKEKDEEVVATVHQRSTVIDEIEAIVTANPSSDSIAAYSDDEIRILNLSEIDCITVLNGKTYAVDSNAKKHFIRKRLYEIEEMLPPDFIRINKSSIGNRKRIHRFITTISGGVDAEFKSGFTDYVSRRCFADIKRRYGL